MKLMTCFVTSAIILALVYGLPWLRSSGPSTLANRALNGSNDADQTRAAQELCQFGEAGRPFLRDVLEKSQNPNVVGLCILELAHQLDSDAAETIFSKLDDDSLAVRSAAVKALRHLLGADYAYPVDGTAAERNAVRDQMRKDWKRFGPERTTRKLQDEYPVSTE